MQQQCFLSVCIPSYNRPNDIVRLLESLDYEGPHEIEIVICEDYAPKRDQVKKNVCEFASTSKYRINYIENEINYGYDKNLRRCIENASGQWILFMGDDDTFVKNAMNEYIEYLHSMQDIGYVLRSYQTCHSDKSIELFKYFQSSQIFPQGEETYIKLFRKSVFISGFTFKRELAVKNLTNKFDGTLLYQLYIQAEICMNYKSAYYDKPITQSTDGGIPYFGSSAAEKSLYTPGKVMVQNSINFIKQFLVITQYMDKKYNINSTSKFKMDASKYSYPILSIQRKNGKSQFKSYAKELKKLGFDCSCYFYIYYYALLIIGEKPCENIIRFIKKVVGKTPEL